MPIDIAYIVSHGFAARMVMQTGLLRGLIQKGHKVALISPDANDANLKKYCDEHQITLIEYKSQSTRWSGWYMEKRKYFLENIEENTALFEKYIWATKYNQSKNPINHILPYYGMFCYKLIKRFPSIRNNFIKNEKGRLKNDDAIELLEKYNIQLIVSTYPVAYSEAELLYAAELLKKKSVIHLLSWDNISCKGRFPALAENYIAWGPIMKAEFIQYYNIPEDHIYQCGVPHFDLHYQIKTNPNPFPYLKQLGLNSSKPYLFFGMSSPRFAPAEIDIVEWLARKIEENEFGENMQMIIRPHPQNMQGSMADASWLPRLERLKSSRIGVDYPELAKSNLAWSMAESDMDRLSNLLAGSILCLNSGSTLSIDALQVDKPVILTSFDGDKKYTYWKSAKRLIDFAHLKKFINFGGVTVTHSFEELKNAINLYIVNPMHDWDKRQNTRFQECGEANGKATENVRKVLISLIIKK
jgi:hypothetical protein